MSENNKVISYQCPSCGHPIPVGSPMCPGCHRIFKQEDLGNYAVEIEKIRDNQSARKDEQKFRRGAVIFVVVFILALAAFIISIEAKKSSIDKEMQQIYQQVQTAILAEDYDLAMLNVQNLRPDKGLSKDLTEKWDQIREDTIKLIEQKQKGK